MYLYSMYCNVTQLKRWGNQNRIPNGYNGLAFVRRGNQFELWQKTLARQQQEALVELSRYAAVRDQTQIL